MEEDLNKKIEEVKKHYLVSQDIDDEVYQDNLTQINIWEKSLRDAESFDEWQHMDITMELVKKLKDYYIENAIKLGTLEQLKEVDRIKLWSVQDSIKWLLSLMVEDTKSIKKQINSELERAIEFETL